MVGVVPDCTSLGRVYTLSSFKVISIRREPPYTGMYMMGPGRAVTCIRTIGPGAVRV